jgi:hypothetical protein
VIVGLVPNFTNPLPPLVPASAAVPGSVLPAVVQAEAEHAAERAAGAGLSADQRAHAAEAERLHLARCAWGKQIAINRLAESRLCPAEPAPAGSAYVLSFASGDVAVGCDDYIATGDIANTHIVFANIALGRRFARKSAAADLFASAQAGGPSSSELLQGLAAAPQRFAGRTGSSSEAADYAARNLEVFLEELECSFELCHVPEFRRHALAAGFLAGDAKLNYLVQSGTQRTASKPVDMFFFRETLRATYVGPAQNALALEGWHACEWAAPALRGPFLADSYLARYEEALTAVRRLPAVFQPQSAWQCQVLLGSLPVAVRGILRLDGRNEPLTDVDAL